MSRKTPFLGSQPSVNAPGTRAMAGGDRSPLDPHRHGLLGRDRSLYIQ